MELRELHVNDVYPDENNPRKDFGNIDALAESCMLNAINPGEPVNPIVVVQDGGIYRIVDGERRYKAIRQNKLTHCHAVVCDGIDEANAMVAMVATDDKQQLSEIERSRGVQQMMLLGVDPECVEKAGRIPKGSFAKLRRARAAVDDAGDDMTLDRMLAIAEFEDAGDDEAVRLLTNCNEREWRSEASMIDSLRRAQNEYEDMLAECTKLGIEVFEKPLKGSRLIRNFYSSNKDLLEKIDPAKSIIVMPEPTEDNRWLEVAEYSSPAAVSDEEQAQIASLNKIKHAMTLAKRRRAEFVASRMNDPSTMKNTLRHFTGIASESEYYGSRFRELSGIAEIPPAANAWMVAYLWESADGMTQAAITDIYRDTDTSNCGWKSLRTVATTFQSFLAALVRDGYEPDDFEDDLLAKCKEILSAGEE